MKDVLNKTMTISRTSLTDLRKIFTITRTVALADSINEDSDVNTDLKIDIPLFGTVTVNKDFDFEFTPCPELRKDVYTLRQNPNTFFKNELKKIFKIGDMSE